MNDVNNTCVSYSGAHNLLLGSEKGGSKVSKQQIFHSGTFYVQLHITL